MGLANWLNELSPARRLGVALATGAAVCASAYGLYVYLAKRTDGGERRAGPDDEIPERRILVLGLDGAGKSTFLGALAQQNAVSPPSPQPTEGFHVICITTEGFKLNIWEIGGAEKFRSYWPNFFEGTSLLVYVVDASDHQRFEESQQALTRLLTDDRLRGIPVVLVASKQDLPKSKTSAEITAMFGVQETLQEGRKFGAVGIQVLESGESDGLQEAKQLILSLSAE